MPSTSSLQLGAHLQAKLCRLCLPSSINLKIHLLRHHTRCPVDAHVKRKAGRSLFAQSHSLGLTKVDKGGRSLYFDPYKALDLGRRDDRI